MYWMGLSERKLLNVYEHMKAVTLVDKKCSLSVYPRGEKLHFLAVLIFPMTFSM